MFYALVTAAHVALLAALCAAIYVVRRHFPSPYRDWTMIVPFLAGLGLLAILVFMPHWMFPR